MRRSLLLLLLPLAGALAGCYSKLVVAKADPEADPERRRPCFLLPKSRRSLGIPHQLVTPEFILVATPPSADSPRTTYEVNLTYRPDPDHRYFVRFKPAWCSDADFAVKLGSGGELTSTTAASREKVTPVIKAIGKFTVGAIGVAATAVGLPLPISPAADVRAVPPTEHQRRVAEITKRVNGNTETDGARRLLILKTPVDPRAPYEPATREQAQAWHTLEQRLLEPQTEAAFLATLHARTPVERRWLETARFLTATARIAKRHDKAFKSQLNALLGEIPEETRKELREGILGALDGLDVRGLRAVEDRIKGLSRYTRNGTFRDDATQFFQTAENRIRALAELQKQAELVRAILELNEKEWRNRHAAYLEERIYQLERNDIVSHVSTPNPEIAKCQKLWDQTVGTVEERARLNALLDFLKRLPVQAVTAVPGKDKGKPFDQYTTGRVEFDRVLAQIDAKRNALRPRREKPVVSRSRPPVAYLPSAGDRTVTLPKLLSDYATKRPRPRFLIVLEKLDGGH